MQKFLTMKVKNINDPQYKDEVVTKVVKAWVSKNSNEELHDPADVASFTLTYKVYRFMDSVTMHGVRYIFMREIHRIRRLLWLLVVLIGMGYCSYVIYEAFSSYLAYPTTSKMRTKFEQRSEFPAVTICNYNMFRKSKLTPKQRDAIKYVYASRFVPPTNRTHNFMALDDLNIEEFMLNTTNAFVPMVCLYKGRSCDKTLFKLTLTDYGYCYVFDASRKQHFKYQDSAGQEGGLDMADFINASEWTYGPRMPYYGIRVTVHAPETQVHFLRDKGFSIVPGYTTDVTIARREVQLLPPPYGQCGSTNLTFFNEYSREKCLLECESRHALDVCGCKFIHMPGNGSVCTLHETLHCKKYLSDAFDEHSNIFDQTKCNCPQECQYVEYQVEVRPTAISPGYKDLLSNSFGFDMNNGFQLRLYYKDLEYIEAIEEAVYSFEKLMCDCGGAGGLFLGCSFATMYEFIEFSGEIVWMWAVRQYNLKKRSTTIVN